MTLQSIVGNAIMPLDLYISGQPAEAVAVLDADGEYCCCVFKIPKTGTLKKIGISTGAVTTADTITVRLETVDDTSGQPTGTLYAANANGEQAAPSANTTYWVALNGATGVSVTQGDIVAIKVSLTFVDGNLEISYRIGGLSLNFPYCGEYLGAAWTLRSNVGNFGLEYDTGIVQCEGLNPALDYASVGFGNNDDPERRGLVFQVPFKCQIVGAWVDADLDGNCALKLYDSDQATVLESVTLDSNIRGSTNVQRYHVLFSQARELTINTNYRITLEPSSATDVVLHYVDLTDDGAVVAMNGLSGGSTWQYTTAADVPVNEASWTNTSTRRPCMGIIINQLDDGGPTDAEVAQAVWEYANRTLTA